MVFFKLLGGKVPVVKVCNREAGHLKESCPSPIKGDKWIETKENDRAEHFRGTKAENRLLPTYSEGFDILKLTIDALAWKPSEKTAAYGGKPEFKHFWFSLRKAKRPSQKSAVHGHECAFKNQVRQWLATTEVWSRSRTLIPAQYHAAAGVKRRVLVRALTHTHILVHTQKHGGMGRLD